MLIDYLNEKLGNDIIKFYPGVSYRHIMVVKGGNKHLDCTPPHDVLETPFKEVLVKAESSEAEGVNCVAE